MKFFEMGEILLNRVEELIPELDHIAIVAKGTAINTQHPLSCYIIPDTTDISTESSSKTQNFEVQRWAVLLVINHSASQTDIREVLDRSSIHIDKLLQYGNLNGWLPPGYLKKLKRVKGSSIDYPKSGTIAVPFIFEISFIP